MENIEKKIQVFTQKARHQAQAYHDFLIVLAQPLLFSTDFLYKLWLNFKGYHEKDPKKQPSHLIVSDFILSSLCQPIGTDLFRFEDEIREYLLSKTTKELRQDVALFVEEYALRNKSSLNKNIFEIHSLFAKGVLRPKEMEKEIIEKLKSSQNPSKNLNYLNLYFNSLPLTTEGNTQAGISFQLVENADQVDVFKLNALPKRMGESLEKVKDKKKRKYTRGTYTVKNKKGWNDFFIHETHLNHENITIRDSEIGLLKIKNINKLKKISVISSSIKELNIEYSSSKYIDEVRTTNSTIKLLKLEGQLNVSKLSSNRSSIENLYANAMLELEDIRLENQHNISFVRDSLKLKKLDLKKIFIPEIGIIAHLTKLQILILHENEMSDINGIENLFQLRSLTIDNNSLEYIFNLAKLDGLNFLSLENNRIKDISPLSKIQNLKHLYLKFNAIDNVEILKYLPQLNTLDLSFNNISDISFLSELKNLEYLHLNNNQITDISPILELPNLKELYLQGNPIENIPKEIYDFDGNCLESVRKYFEQLETEEKPKEVLRLEEQLGFELREYGMKAENVLLAASIGAMLGNSHSYLLNDKKQIIGLDLNQKNCDWSKFAILSELEHLVLLNLEYSYYTSNISFLSALKNLTYLNLGFNSISDISPLSSLKELTYLNLSHGSIIDFSFLCNLEKLTYLKLKNSQISDISFLSDLKDLTSLNLEENQVSDVSFLSGLKGLTSLRLEGNQISDISPILKLPNLKELYLRGNPIENIPKEIYDIYGNCLEKVKDYFQNTAMGQMDKEVEKIKLDIEQEWKEDINTKIEELDQLAKSGRMERVFEYLDLYFDKNLNEEYTILKKEFLTVSSPYFTTLDDLIVFLNQEIVKEAISFIEQEQSVNELNRTLEQKIYGIEKEVEGLERSIKILIDKREHLRRRLVISYDAQQKFTLKRQVEEIEIELEKYKERLKNLSQIDKQGIDSMSTIRANKIITQLSKREKYLENISNKKTKYKIEEVKKKRTRIDIEVALKDITQADILQDIAYEIRKKNKYSKKTLFIGFWIEYQKRRTGYWARTFEPNLSLKVQGIQIDEEIRVIANFKEGYGQSENIIGVWADVIGRNYRSISFENGIYVHTRHYENSVNKLILNKEGDIFTWKNSNDEYFKIKNDKLELYAENGNRLSDSFISIFNLPVSSGGFFSGFSIGFSV